MNIVKWATVYQETKGGVWQLCLILSTRKVDARMVGENLKSKHGFYAVSVQKVVPEQLHD